MHRQTRWSRLCSASWQQHRSCPAIPPCSFLPLSPCILCVSIWSLPSSSAPASPGGPRTLPHPGACSLRAGALQSNRNESAFPSPCSQIWTIRHASALICFALGFLEPFCGTAGEGFSFSSRVLCSLNKPGWRNTGGRVLNAAGKKKIVGFPLMHY